MLVSARMHLCWLHVTEEQGEMEPVPELGDNVVP